jgi:serine/threonine protein kinase/Leucine-rich repeat (LRR) protein
MRTLIGRRVGDYDIEAEIGRGAFGVVYRARQVSLNRPVALKVLPTHFAQDQAYIGRFKREAQAAAALSHSNIVHVHAAGTTDDLHYFVMEYVEGETLHDRLAREGRIPADEAIAICVYLAQALDYAWKKARIIHRDLKPSNVMVSRDGEVKLADLGLAKSVGDKDGQTVGTAYFMSPEQARGEHGLDFRSDIYSLGCTLYQMISGRYPYEGTFGTVIAKQITEPPPAILTVAPDCPMPVVKLLAKMLAKHPTARQQSYEELIEDLRRTHEQIVNPSRRGRREEAVVPAAEPAEPPHVGSYIKKPAVLYTAMTTATIIALAGVLVWAPWKQTEQQPVNSEDAKARSAPVTQTILSAAAESPKNASEAPAENVGGASAPRPAQAEGQTVARSATEQSRGTEAPPTFQKPTTTPPPVAERASVQQSEQPSADGTLARSATNAAVIQVAQATPPATPPAPAPAPASAAQPPPPQPADEAFIKSVSAMQPEQQVQAVVGKLKELNPAFDGKETHKIEGGAVTTLSFSTVGVTDISPVKALRWLRTLSMAPPALNQKGSVENLAPLQGMQLTWLWCHNNPITDLSPLKGLPLTTLSFGGTQVSDLSPLVGMKLQVLSFNDTVVSDIAALEGMPLTVLWCNNTKVTDLSPLKAAPLREIKCDFVAERDAAILRGIRTLAKINDLPAATFWMRVGPVVASATPAANVGGTSGPRPITGTPSQLTMPTSTTGGLSAKKQIEQFVAKMKQLNPEFDDSTVKWAGDKFKVVELEFLTRGVTNISPVTEFKGLRVLRCGRWHENGDLTDLSPIKGLPLTELRFPFTKVADLSPVQGMRLVHVDCYNTPVSDLSPLRGMPIAALYVAKTQVQDLAPLAGMPLTDLDCWGTRVNDLSPLKTARLRIFNCSRTHVSDLSVLRGMPLEVLSCSRLASVSDFSFLKGLPLRILACDFIPERDTTLLRSMKTLETINGLPAKEFWKRVEAGEAPQAK